MNESYVFAFSSIPERGREREREKKMEKEREREREGGILLFSPHFMLEVHIGPVFPVSEVNTVLKFENIVLKFLSFALKTM